MRLSVCLSPAPYLLRPVVFAGSGDGWIALHRALAQAGVRRALDGRIDSIGAAISLIADLSPEERVRLEAVVEAAPDAGHPARALALVEHTTKIMVVGGWDPASVREGGLQHTTPHVMTRWMDADDFERPPITVFKKFPTGIAAPGAALSLPVVSLVGSAPISGRYVADAALAVVIGKPALRIAPKDALGHVFGAAAMLDVWNDDVFVEEARVRRGMVARNLTALSPIGPWLETVDATLADADREIMLEVDGVVRQRFMLGELAYSIADVISYCSSVGLTAGDVIAFGARIAMGTGAGPLETPVAINPGERVRVVAAGLQPLVATVAAGAGYNSSEGPE